MSSFIICVFLHNYRLPYISILVNSFRQISFSFFSSASGFQRPDTPPIGGLVLHAGIEGDLIVCGGGQAGGVVDGHLGHAGDGIVPSAQRGGEGDYIAVFQRVDFTEVIAHTPVVVEWGGTALPHSCGRFAPPPLRTVLTPLDVHGSPSLLRLTKLSFHESAYDSFHRPLTFCAAWQS